MYVLYVVIPSTTLLDFRFVNIMLWWAAKKGAYEEEADESFVWYGVTTTTAWGAAAADVELVLPDLLLVGR